MNKVKDAPSIIPFQTDSGRYYRVGALAYPSVTTILEKTASPEDQERLRKWRQKLNKIHGDDAADLVSQEAMERGTRLHEVIAHHLAGELPELDDEILPYWQQAKLILAALSNPRHCEQRIYHSKYRYAGTLDLVADWQGKQTLIDWKTSHRIKRLTWLKDYQLQTAAYAKAFEWMHQALIEQTLVVVLTPERAQLFAFDGGEMDEHWQLWQERLQKFHRCNVLKG